jgi:2-dehydro-3-deoxyphosphogluconate aldolase/(4S)-4-hydroxy-2-oxoglutarate aldolase
MNEVLAKVNRSRDPVIPIEDAAKACPWPARDGGRHSGRRGDLRTAAGEEAIRQIAQNCPEVLVGAGTLLKRSSVTGHCRGARFHRLAGYNEHWWPTARPEASPCCRASTPPT